MPPQSVERNLKMNGVSKNYATIPMSILKAYPSKPIENINSNYNKDECRTCTKEPSVSLNDKDTSYNCYT